MREYLKIKDDVDLKELEKFGFKFSAAEKTYIHTDVDNYEYNNGDDFSVLVYCDDYYVKPEGKEPYIFIHKGVLMQDGIGYDLYEIPTIVFDLIQAGLVEKVVEE